MRAKHRKPLRCRLLWHVRPYVPAEPVQFNSKYRCRGCGMVGLVDSQGNLF